MASKRLIKELDQYNKDPSPAVIRLEPTNDDDLLHLTAVLKGPDGTAYEGIPHRRAIVITFNH
jgi:peroxin-4